MSWKEMCWHAEATTAAQNRPTSMTAQGKLQSCFCWNFVLQVRRGDLFLWQSTLMDFVAMGHCHSPASHSYMSLFSQALARGHALCLIRKALTPPPPPPKLQISITPHTWVVIWSHPRFPAPGFSSVMTWGCCDPQFILLPVHKGCWYQHDYLLNMNYVGFTVRPKGSPFSLNCYSVPSYLQSLESWE